MPNTSPKNKAAAPTKDSSTKMSQTDDDVWEEKDMFWNDALDRYFASDLPWNPMGAGSRSNAKKEQDHGKSVILKKDDKNELVGKMTVLKREDKEGKN